MTDISDDDHRLQHRTHTPHHHNRGRSIGMVDSCDGRLKTNDVS